jgi:hypothetical protein
MPLLAAAEPAATSRGWSRGWTARHPGWRQPSPRRTGRLRSGPEPEKAQLPSRSARKSSQVRWPTACSGVRLAPAR